MQIDILAVGRMKSGPERELYDRYSDRITKSGKSLHFIGPRLYEVPESKSSNPLNRKDEEASALLAKLADGARVVLLDERGSDMTSSELADLLTAEQGKGTQSLAFGIGGPDGHGDALRDRAFRSIRFGKMTWPHQLARTMLAEQVYRAITILSGHPYHRE